MNVREVFDLAYEKSQKQVVFGIQQKDFYAAIPFEVLSAEWPRAELFKYITAICWLKKSSIFMYL